MKKTRILSGVCASAMMLSLAATAFAADSPTNKTLKVAGQTSMPTINMVMPTNGAVLLNPYKLKVTIDKVTYQNQIDSPTMFVQNLSDVAVKVELQASATPSADITLASGTLATNEDEDKKAFVALLAHVQDDAKTPLEIPTGTIEAKDPTADDTGIAVMTGEAAGFGGLEATDAATTGVNLLAAGVNGKLAAEDGVLALRYTGDVNTKAVTTWGAKDKVDSTIVFNFVPQVNTVEAE